MNEAVLRFVSPCQNGFVPGGFIAENLMPQRTWSARGLRTEYPAAVRNWARAGYLQDTGWRGEFA